MVIKKKKTSMPSKHVTWRLSALLLRVFRVLLLWLADAKEDADNEKQGKTLKEESRGGGNVPGRRYDVRRNSDWRSAQLQQFVVELGEYSRAFPSPLLLVAMVSTALQGPESLTRLTWLRPLLSDKVIFILFLEETWQKSHLEWQKTSLNQPEKLKMKKLITIVNLS